MEKRDIMCRKKVLITGAAGEIGRVLAEGLRQDYDLRLLYHKTVLPAVGNEEIFVGSINNMEDMIKATAGIDTVIHMAGNPDDKAGFEEVMGVNIQGTYTTFEAAKRSGVNQIIFASTNHVTGYYEIEGVYTTPDMPVRPDGYYGVSKVFGEALGRYYADAFGISVICLRIGTCRSEDAVIKRKNDRILSTWLSLRDTVHMVKRSIEAESIKFGIYYGISNNTRASWDIRNAREELGYDPQDNSENYV